MKVVFSILLYVFVSETNALTLRQIEGIDSLVQEVNFDSDGNIYAALNNYADRHELYKIDATSKEILWKVDYPANLGTLVNSLVTSRNELYLNFFSSDEEVFPLGILQPGSTDIQAIEKDFVDFLFTLDGNDDLLYLKQEGIYILRPNSTAPIPVKNLENSFIFQSEAVEIDKSGNVYLGLVSGLVAVISSEAQQEDVPSATFINDSDTISRFVQDIALDGNDNLWTLSSDGYTTTIKKLNNDVLEIITTDDTYTLHRIVSAKDKIFIIATSDTGDGFIYYITLNGEIVRWPELEYLNFGQYNEAFGVADSEGNVYFYPTEGKFSRSLGPLIRVNSGDDRATPIEFDIDGWNVDFIRLDTNDDLWIKLDFSSFLTVAVYHLEKGEAIPEKVNIPLGIGCNYYIGDIYVNKVTKEVYVSCTDGLYVVVEDEINK